MPKRYRKPGAVRRRHFLKEWRQFANLTQEQMVERLSVGGASVTAATLSRIERGELPYTQDMLEAFAYAVGCEPADLIMRNPLDTDAVWSILDNLKGASEGQKAQMAAIADAFLKKTGT